MRPHEWAGFFSTLSTVSRSVQFPGEGRNSMCNDIVRKSMVKGRVRIDLSVLELGTGLGGEGMRLVADVLALFQQTGNVTQ